MIGINFFHNVIIANILLGDRFLMTDHRQDGTEVISRSLSRVPGWGVSQPKQFVYTSLAESSASLNKKGEVNL